MKKTISVLLGAVMTFTISAAFSDAENRQEEATPSKSDGVSKIRLFGQNGIGVIFYKNSKCSGGSDSVRVSGGLTSAFSSFLGAVKNESLGIPETDTTRSLSQRSGILSKAYFKEYEIDPGNPITIVMRFQDVGIRKHCGNIAGTFIPEPSVNYEGHLDLDLNAGVCRFSIDRVSNDGSLSPISLDPAQACK